MALSISRLGSVALVAVALTACGKSAGPPMKVARWLATGSVLADGRFLVCGGGNPLIGGNDAVEAYSA